MKVLNCDFTNSKPKTIPTIPPNCRAILKKYKYNCPPMKTLTLNGNTTTMNHRLLMKPGYGRALRELTGN